MASITNARSFNPVYRLGVVAFLNARPLIAGLNIDNRVELRYGVPAQLPEWLEAGKVDVALVPIVDVLRGGGRYRVLSDACIGCDGETMTVRVFSQTPPDRLRTLWVDNESHTSVALASLLWRELYDRELVLRPLEARRESLDELESVLLIGDKVVAPGRGGFAYEVDLGGAWRQHTGLPFVFAVWACRTASREEEPRASARADQRARETSLAQLLSAARDRGVARAAQIAATHGPKLGWPVELARRYLTRRLNFTLDARSIEGANLFGRLCAQAGIVPADAEISWPEDLLAQETV
ncbi:MAG: menaquinone biosynthetic enzyme MqnA/MqnD family protein [Phycisphaerae bacterium]